MAKKDEGPVGRAAIYCRVSTEEQAKGDFTSLDSQKAILSNYAALLNLDIYQTYQDTASGKDLNRPGFLKMMADAEEGKFDKILITRIDRISRNIKNFLDLAERLDVLKIHLLSKAETIDTSTIVGRALRNILVMFGQMEREMGNERTREKMISMIREGLWTGGLTPLGYDLIDKKLVVNETESKLVNNIFNYYLETPSTLKVAQKLNTLGYKTKIRITRKGDRRGGGKYSKSTVDQILRNVVYVGKRKYSGELYNGKHQPIVSDELFQKVQARLDKSKKEKHLTRNTDSPHTLTGILECGICGNLMTSSYAKPRQKKYFIYRCTTRNKDTKQKCSAKDIKQEELENFIRIVIKQLVSDEKFFDSVFKRMLYDSKSVLTELKEKYSALRINLNQRKTEITNILNAISQVDSVKVKPLLFDKLESLELIRAELEMEMNDLEQKISVRERQNINKNELRSIFKKYISSIQKVSVEKQKRINHLLFEKIISRVDSQTGEGEIIVKIKADGEITQNLSKINDSQVESTNFRNIWYPGEDSNLRPAV